MNATDKIYTQSPDFISREVADEFILVPIRKHLLSSQNIYVLNQTGATFWRAIDGKLSLADIVRRIANEFEVSEDQLEKDLAVLIEDLVSIQAVEEICPAKS